MSRLIVEFDNKYLEWCPKSQAPVTKLMSEPELLAYVRDTYGEPGVAALPDQLTRVRRIGTSSVIGLTKRTLLLGNRAGAQGRTLSTEAEMVAHYAG
jgi:hypothetical protein